MAWYQLALLKRSYRLRKISDAMSVSQQNLYQDYNNIHLALLTFYSLNDKIFINNLRWENCDD